MFRIFHTFQSFLCSISSAFDFAGRFYSLYLVFVSRKRRSSNFSYIEIATRINNNAYTFFKRVRHFLSRFQASDSQAVERKTIENSSTQRGKKKKERRKRNDANKNQLACDRFTGKVEEHVPSFVSGKLRSIRIPECCLPVKHLVSDTEQQ